MTEFRFLHAADIHLDSPLRGLAGQEDATAERIRGAAREAFERLIDDAIAERIDFMVIAGDLYDGEWRDYSTGLYFAAQMGRLDAASIPVYLLHGNHDAESEITRHLPLPGNVKTFGTKAPETFHHPDLPVALHGQSFPRRDVDDNLALAYPAPLAGRFNIGVLHTGLGGRGGHANYAPCTLADLVNTGYDYWALGHVHQGEVLHERPHIVFSGNLQGRHIRETGPKGAMAVTVDGGEVVAVDARAYDIVRWENVRADVTDLDDMARIHNAVRTVLEAAVATRAEGRLLACRLHLEGRSPLHARLHAAGDELLAEVRALALGLGEGVAWVEKIAIATAPLADATGGEGVEDLRRILGTLTEGDLEDLAQRFESDIGAMVGALPREAREEVEDDVLRLAIEGDHRALARAVEPHLFARLDVEGEA